MLPAQLKAAPNNREYLLAPPQAPTVEVSPPKTAPPPLPAPTPAPKRDTTAIIKIFTQLQESQQEVANLRGMVENQQEIIDDLKQRQKELYLDIDRRLRQLTEYQSAQQQQVVITSLNNTNASIKASKDKQGTSAYKTAFDALKNGRYNQSILAFQDFVESHPNSELTSNAYYWIGEAFYVTGRFDQSAESFNSVIQLYPDSSKTPDAMLKLGYSYFELEDLVNAERILKNLQQQFPQKTAAHLANKRLQLIRKKNKLN